jgi:hypothetical protein
VKPGANRGAERSAGLPAGALARGEAASVEAEGGPLTGPIALMGNGTEAMSVDR